MKFKPSYIAITLNAVLFTAVLAACSKNEGGGASGNAAGGQVQDAMMGFPATPIDTFQLALEAQSVKTDVPVSELIGAISAREEFRQGLAFENSDLFALPERKPRYASTPTDEALRAMETNLQANCNFQKPDRSLFPEGKNPVKENSGSISGPSCPVAVQYHSKLTFELPPGSDEETKKREYDVTASISLVQSESRTIGDIGLRTLLEETSASASSKFRMITRESRNAEGVKREVTYARVQQIVESVSSSGFVYKADFIAELMKTDRGDAQQILFTINTRAGILKVFRMNDDRAGVTGPSKKKTIVNGVPATDEQERTLTRVLFKKFDRSGGLSSLTR